MAKKPYFVVSNNIIKYSCAINPYVLPVYLYSWIHSQFSNNNLVDTNIALISSTLAPSKHDNGINTVIKNVLKLLGDEVQDYRCADGTVIPGFSQAIAYRINIDNVSTTTRLKYDFLDSTVKYINGFTMIPFEAYNKIIDWCDDHNYIISHPEFFNKKGKIINAVDMINVYAYMKMKSSIYENNGGKMKEGIETICKAFNRDCRDCGESESQNSSTQSSSSTQNSQSQNSSNNCETKSCETLSISDNGELDFTLDDFVKKSSVEDGSQKENVKESKAKYSCARRCVHMGVSNGFTHYRGLQPKTIKRYLNLLCQDEKVEVIVDRDGVEKEVSVGGVGVLSF